MKQDTGLTRAGRPGSGHEGAVNPPVVRTSTVLFPTVERMQEARRDRDTGMRVFSYGARGTPTAFALEDALCELERGERAFLYPSGLAAIASVLLAVLRPGDRLAVVDTIYPPVRRFCRRVLEPKGIAVAYFAPEIAALDACLGEPTAAILAESPGSGTFEVLDLPAIAARARRLSVPLIVDNTWSAGYFHKPLELGADISIQAITKYIGGHSDVVMGAAVVNGDLWQLLYAFNEDMGLCVSPDDAYAALRGIRSLGTRLRQHESTAHALAEWLAGRPEVQAVRHPAFPDCPGHGYWRRDFSGASGLFAFALNSDLVEKTGPFVDSLALFGIGSSWGGYESLALPVSPKPIRSAEAWTGPEQLVRISAGLEDASDLIADLAQALDGL